MTQNVPHSTQSFAEANGIEIAYDTLGDPNAPPLLLIMGLGGQLINWHEEFCAQLATRGYCVIRFDNRDVGLSTKFDEAGVPDIARLTEAQERGEEVKTPYTLRDMANDAIGLLDALEIDSAHVLGTSMGGRIAQMMAIHHPHRIRTLTSIMASMGETGFPPPKPEALSILLTPTPTDRVGYIENTVQTSYVLNGPWFPIDELRIRERAEQAFDRGIYPDGVTRQLAALMTAESSKMALNSLRVPALVIHGSDDPLVPKECAMDMANTIPGAKLLIIQGMGHALADIPQIWPQVIDAVARHTA
jgi:pimeloyl-ACP methyl ester carboxylesterase